MAKSHNTESFYSYSAKRNLRKEEIAAYKRIALATVIIVGLLAAAYFVGVPFIARMGGDEILIVLVGIRTTADAVAVMESVLKAVNTDHPFGDITLQPRISIGLTALARDEGLDTAISRADQAMYRAKTMGGNQITLHEDLSPTS